MSRWSCVDRSRTGEGRTLSLVLLSKIVPLLILLVLSACNGITLYYSVPEGSSYSFEDVQQAAASGGIYADVVGSLTGRTKTNFRQRVRRLMSGDINGVPIKFVGEIPPEIASDYRVVVWFKPSSNRRHLNLCTYKGGVAAHQDPRRAEVAMALCSGERLLSSSSGVFFFLDVDPQETNRFRNLIRSATAALFPKRVYQEDREFERWL